MSIRKRLMGILEDNFEQITGMLEEIDELEAREVRLKQGLNSAQRIIERRHAQARDEKNSQRAQGVFVLDKRIYFLCYAHTPNVRDMISQGHACLMRDLSDEPLDVGEYCEVCIRALDEDFFRMGDHSKS